MTHLFRMEVWGRYLFVVACVLCQPISLSATPLDVVFTKIAGTGTPAPDSTGNFTTFTQNPAISNGVVVFTGTDDGSATHGLYTGDGGALDVIANTQTLIPGSSNGARFSGYGDPAIDDGRIAFRGSGGTTAVKGNNGIYVYDGTITVYANDDTFVPGTTNFFEPAFGQVDIDGNTVVFSNGLSRGVYSATSPGNISLIADDTTQIPGSAATFHVVSNPLASDGVVVYRGGDGTPGGVGFYRFDGTAHTLVADKNTVYPGTAFNLEAAGAHAFADGVVAFAPRAGPTEFIYRWDNGVLSLVADVNTAIPEGSGNFSDFALNDVAAGDGVVAFRGFNIGGQDGIEEGIYVDVGGGLAKVVDRNDMLEGKLVQNFTLGHEGLDNNQLAFRVSFTDGTESIYRADFTVVPLPPAMALLLFPIAAVFATRRRAERSSAHL